MISVIADDFTGAAEIGGVGLKYGLDVIIETTVTGVKKTDLLIIVSDTRSLPPKQASEEINRITGKLLKLNPESIFKKLDSVLRGNVAAELYSQLTVTGQKRAVLIAGNPWMGRNIQNGYYSIHSVPLAETSFANDPEFPIRSSSVVKIIGEEYCPVHSCSVDSRLPEEGLIVGDVNNENDILRWALTLDNKTLAAGGAGFFDVLLSTKYQKKEENSNGHLQLGDRTLFVFGSTYPKSREIVDRLKKERVLKLNMPEAIYNNVNFKSGLLDEWARRIADSLDKNRKVIISIEQTHSLEPGLSLRIRDNIGELVRKVSALTRLTDLLIEGGATTSAILKSLNISKLFPYKELDLGIIQMKVERYPDLNITTKPGSYSWPDSVVFDNRKNN